MLGHKNFLMVTRNVFWAALYFFIAAALTIFFISGKLWLYSSERTMRISAAITGIKWLVQVIAAIVLLGDKKWTFIRGLGFVCLSGSLTLYLYYLFPFLPIAIDGFSQFIVSVASSILVTILMYYNIVQQNRISVAWFFGWAACLSVSFLLQSAFVLCHAC
jgi:hypothetical protein